MKNLKDLLIVNEVKDYSDFDTESSNKLYDIYYDQCLKRFINAFIHFIEDGHYTKTGWESNELKKLLPKLKSLKQNAPGMK